MTKVNKLLLISAIILISLLTLVSCNTISSVYQSWANCESYSIGGGSFAGDTIDSISVDWVSGDIQIAIADVAEITIYEDCNKVLEEYQQMRHYVNNGNLDIKFIAPNTSLLNWNLNKNLVVQIPQTLVKTFDSLNIDSVSSTVTIDSINADNANIDSVSGKVSINIGVYKYIDLNTTSGGADFTDLTMDGLNIDSVSGSINITDCAVSDIDIDSTSGNIVSQTTSMPANIDIDAVSGNIRIILPENAGFTLDYDSVSGSLSNAFATTISGDDRYIYGDGTNKISINNTSGDLAILRL